MITVHNLHKTYGTQTVLAGVNASFAAGRLTSLIGPNGAGKTTLLMMIARLMEPTAGEVRLEGREFLDHELDAGLRAKPCWCAPPLIVQVWSVRGQPLPQPPGRRGWPADFPARPRHPAQPRR